MPFFYRPELLPDVDTIKSLGYFWTGGSLLKVCHCGGMMANKGQPSKSRSKGIESNENVLREWECRDCRVAGRKPIHQNHVIPEPLRSYFGINQSVSDTPLFDYAKQMVENTSNNATPKQLEAKTNKGDTDQIIQVAQTISADIAPTLAEFEQAIAEGWLPAPDIEFMGIPLYKASTLSRAKTEGTNPKNYTDNFVLHRDVKITLGGLPPELGELSQFSGIEFYRVEGATNHRLAIGLKVTGRKKDKGTLRHALSACGFGLSSQERHLVTAWLALDYLGEARDNKELASNVKGMKDRGLERQLNSEIARIEDPAIPADAGIYAALRPVAQQLEVVSARLVALEMGQDELKAGQQVIMQMVAGVQSLINASIDTFQDAECWINSFADLKARIELLLEKSEYAQAMLDLLCRTKRQKVDPKLEALHAQFIWDFYHGFCPVDPRLQIVGINANGVPEILRDENGNKLGEVDHQYQVNSAHRLTTWLINKPLNRELNNKAARRHQIQREFDVYQKRFDMFDTPLLTAAS